jgi:hypothetical protein
MAAGEKPHPSLHEPKKKHDVKLPKSKSRLSIDETHSAMKQMGYDVGTSVTSFHHGEGYVTKFAVTDSDGASAAMTAPAIKDFVYANAK